MLNRTQPSSFHNQPASLKKKKKEKKKTTLDKNKMAQQNNLSSIPRTHTVKTEKTTTLNCPLIYICVLWNAQYAHIHTHKHTVKTDKGNLRKKRSI